MIGGDARRGTPVNPRRSDHARDLQSASHFPARPAGSPAYADCHSAPRMSITSATPRTSGQPSRVFISSPAKSAPDISSGVEGARWRRDHYLQWQVAARLNGKADAFNPQHVRQLVRIPEDRGGALRQYDLCVAGGQQVRAFKVNMRVH